MNVLVACEESQRVCTAFREKGHNAFSCDIIEPSGGHPEWHILGDVLEILNPIEDLCYGEKRKAIAFTTMDGKHHIIPNKWDLIIAHPPCTFLTNAGTRHFSRRINPENKVIEREEKRREAFDFFMMFVNAECEHICIENPVGYCNSHYRKADQIIHPYFFASSENDAENYYKKRTCLWLKNLPILERTNKLPPPKPFYFCQGNKCNGKPINWVEAVTVQGGQSERAKVRSKTFNGIAAAMAEQWGVIEN